MPFDLQQALRTVVEQDGSDLHLKVPSPPLMRLQGDLVSIGTEPLAPADTERVLREMLTANDRLSEFAREGEIDFSYTVAGLARFRVNAFRQRGSISIACRLVPFSIRSVDELNLPEVISRLANEHRGIILVTGTTGSGKSTTLAAMIDQMNRTTSRNIVTIEDPIEFLHRDQKSIIHQREIGFDTGSFAKALRRVLRQDPDVILIGEMRDEETVHTALSAAETGHLVLSTLHTIDAVETVNRIVDFFPPHQHQQVRAMLAGTLKGVISQRLVPTIDHSGRVAACEVLTMTGRVRDMIMDPHETGKLGEVIGEGGYYGMTTFDQSLFHHFTEGAISMEQALEASTHPHDFKLLVASEGHRSTSVAHLYGDDDEPSETEEDGPAQKVQPPQPSEQTPSQPAPAEQAPKQPAPAQPTQPTQPQPAHSPALAPPNPASPAPAASPPSPAPAQTAPPSESQRERRPDPTPVPERRPAHPPAAEPQRTGSVPTPPQQANGGEKRVSVSPPGSDRP
jgi:twitching motility protein PilT